MRISITTDEGVLIKVFEHVETYDLFNLFSRADLIGEIAEAIRIGLIEEKQSKD